MKYTLVLGVALTNFVVLAFSSASEMDALSVLARQVPGKPLERVVQIVGIRGQHQPKEWRIVVRDPVKPEVFHLYLIQGSRLVRQEQVRKDYRGKVPEASISYQDLKVNSNRVFAIADREAKAAKIGFDSVNYELRCPEFSAQPVWFVDLRDARGGVVGRLFLSAKTGLVLNRIWFPSDRDIAATSSRGSAGMSGGSETGMVRRLNPTQIFKKSR